jgi:DNA-binding GntR family transcriptional regulator
MADTESLIKEWEESGITAQSVAASIARKITKESMRRYDELPLNSVLSDELNVSERTISAAKSILGDHGILIQENRRYYVALSRKPKENRRGTTWKNHRHRQRHLTLASRTRCG